VRILAAAAFAAFALAATARAQDSDRWDARLTAVTGDVVVHPAGGGDEVSGEAGLPLEEGDRVTTADGSTAEIALDGDSLMTLGADSDFTLEDTRKSASIFSLTLGSLLAKIRKLGSQSLSVRSPTAVAAVRGTEFGVDVQGDQSSVGVFDEGRVEVRGRAGGTTILTPNQETSIERGRAPERAGPLRRFAGRRAAMRARVRRLALVRRNWRRMAASQRRAARASSLRRLRRGRLKRLQRRPIPRRAPVNRGRRAQPRRERARNDP
jgi:hypothetical protein